MVVNLIIGCAFWDLLKMHIRATPTRVAIRGAIYVIVKMTP